MRAIVLTVLMLSLPAGLAAQEDAGLARIRQVFPAAAAQQIEAIVQQSRSAGLPAGALVDKALEGAAKGVPADRVVAVVSEYATRLEEARTLIGQERGADEVVAAADALRRGVPADAVRAVAGARQQGDAAIPLVVLGDLMDAGVPVEHAREVVSEALQRGGVDEQLLAIPGAVRRMVREGRAPDEAASAVAQGFRSGQLPPGIPAVRGRGIGSGGAPPVPPGAGPPEGKGPPKGKGHGKPPGGGGSY